MAPMKITATLKAWSSGDYSYRCLMDALRQNNQQEAAEQLAYSNADMDIGPEPWALVGDAEVTVTLRPRDEIAASQIAALQKELEHARAEWLTKQQVLVDRMSKLQALTNEVPAEVVVLDAEAQS